MNEEYEYSFKVSDVKDIVDYCIENDYKEIENFSQIRTLYKNGGKVMARITKNISAIEAIEILNFKDDNLTDSNLNVCRESKDLVIDDTNRSFVKSLLEILELKESKVLKRDRVTYQKNNVKFEIDKYLSPLMNVIAIEGNKENVDAVYKELESVILAVKVDD